VLEVSTIRTSYTVSEVPTDLIVAKNFLGFSDTPIHPPFRHHQDPFSPPPPQRPISRSSLACSCSSWRRASSRSYCHSRSCSSRTHGGAWFLSQAPSSETSGGVFPSWALSMRPSESKIISNSPVRRSWKDSET
jgi:hypothetical protein